MKKQELRYIARYFAGSATSRLADEMTGQTLLLVVLAARQSPQRGALLVAVLTLAGGVGGPFLGAAIDRARRPGTLLAAGLTGYGLAYLGAILTVNRHLPAAAALAALAGLALPAVSGGWSSQLARVAKKPGRLARLAAWDAASFNVAGLVGPGLAGLLALSAGARWSAYLVAALLLTAAPFAARLPPRADIAAAGSAEPRPKWQPVLAQDRLIRATLTSALSYFGLGMLWVGAPLLGLSAAHRAGLGSLLLSVLSSSALIFSLGIGRWSAQRPDFIVGLSTAVMASGFILVGFVPTIWGAGAAFAAIGAADGPQLAALIRIRHRDAPQGLVGQVFTWGSSLKVGAAALGRALAGVIGAHSLAHLFWAAALAQVLALTLFLLWPTRRPAPDR